MKHLSCFTVGTLLSIWQTLEIAIIYSTQQEKQIQLLRNSILKEKITNKNPPPEHPTTVEIIPENEYIKQVAEILNGLNPSTFVKLLPKIKALNLNTEERLSEVSKLLYEKAVEDPNFSLIYAKTCQCLSLKKQSVSNPTDASNFRAMLLARCLNEFDKASTG
uniref:MIF4G domain-containing protein n=1 Tax=Daphnia galeata TaxID=27404 RepID=A0A8J2RQ46_9CRUS|nr:unnamed protein product [Daphnia galeata]